jgi:hypothetical protein
MSRVPHLLFVVLVASVACNAPPPDQIPGSANQSEPRGVVTGSGEPSKRAGVTSDPPGAYSGYQEDLLAMRKTTTVGNPPLRASSDEAIAAARRIFAKIVFKGMPREKVLALLGDPATVSDYGVRAKPGRDEPLTYHFSDGFSGYEYTVRFQGGIAVAVQTRGID